MIIIAIGANLPSPDGATPLQICERAAHAVARLPQLSSATRSRWYSSAPVPASAQPRFINGVLRLEGKPEPASLLSALQAIERAAFRERGEANAARTLDLDIIDMNGLVREAPDPVLPHPRASLRAFVLLPLRDVAPFWVLPGTGESIDSLIAALPPFSAQDIRPLSAPDRVAPLAPWP